MDNESGWEEYECQCCGGSVFLNDRTHQSGHSLPMCAEYMAACNNAEIDGFRQVMPDGSVRKLPST